MFKYLYYYYVLCILCNLWNTNVQNKRGELNTAWSRTVSLPTVALCLLHPAAEKRISFYSDAAGGDFYSCFSRIRNYNSKGAKSCKVRGSNGSDAIVSCCGSIVGNQLYAFFSKAIEMRQLLQRS